MKARKKNQERINKTKHEILDPTVEIRDLDLIDDDYPNVLLERQLDKFMDPNYPNPFLRRGKN